MLRHLLNYGVTSTSKQFFVPVRTMSATDSSYGKVLAAVIQMNCTADKARNLESGHKMVLEAKRRGADVVFLPEAFDYIGENPKQTVEMAEELEGHTVSSYRLVKNYLTLLKVQPRYCC